MKKLSLFFITLMSMVIIGCASNNVSAVRFTITDTMMEPIVEEMFDEMEETILQDWTQRKTKPSVLVYPCFDERYGSQTVTVISKWCQQKLSSCFVKSRKYRVVDEESIERIRNEKKFQRAGYVDDRVMVDEGRELGGDYIVITKIANNGFFEAKITSIKEGHMIYHDAEKIKK